MANAVFTVLLGLTVLGCVFARDSEDVDRCKGFDCQKERRILHRMIEEMKKEGHRDPELMKKVEELRKKIGYCCGHRPHPPQESCEKMELTCTDDDFGWYTELSDSEKKTPEVHGRLMVFKRMWAYCCEKMPFAEGSTGELSDKCGMIECGDHDDSSDNDDHHRDRDDMHGELREHCCKGKHRRHHKKIAIICGAAGGIALLVAAAVVCFCCRRRRRHHRHHHPGKQQQNTSFENLYYGEKMAPPSLGYVSEKKQPLPEGNIVNATYESIPTSGLKPELVLTAPPSYTENVYDNPSK